MNQFGWSLCEHLPITGYYQIWKAKDILILFPCLFGSFDDFKLYILVIWKLILRK